MESQRNKWPRRVLGVTLCCAGLVLTGVLSATAGGAAQPVHPGHGAAVQADGSPVPAPHADLAGGSGPIPPSLG